MKKYLFLAFFAVIFIGLLWYGVGLAASVSPVYLGGTGRGTTTPNQLFLSTTSPQSLTLLAPGAEGSILSIVSGIPTYIATSSVGLMPLSTGTTGYVANWISSSNLSIGTLLDGSVAGVNATSSTVAFNIQGTDTVDPFQVGTSTNASMMIVKGNTGNVGISSSTPSSPLSIGAINKTTGISLQAGGSGSVTNMMNITNTGGNIKWGTNSGTGAAITNGIAYSSFLASGNSTALQLGTNNTAQMTILTSSGNVGINTTTPASQLTVVGTVAIANTGNDRTFNFDSANGNMSLTSAATPFMFFNRFNVVTALIMNGAGGKVGIGTTTTPTADLQVMGSGISSATTGFEVFNFAGTTEFKVRNDGNVGIGLASPGARLYVVGESGAQTTFSKAGSSLFAANTHPAIISSAITGNLFEGYGGTNGNIQYITIKNDGSTGIGTSTPLGALHVVSSSLTNPTLIVQASSTQSSNALEMRDSSGNVDFSVATSGLFSALYGFKSSGSTGTIATSTGNGTGGSATVTGNDQLFHVTLTTGSAPPTSGAVFIYTFATTKPRVPSCFISHTSGATAGFAQYLATSTVSSYTLSAGGAAFTASQTSTYDVRCDIY